MARAKSASNSEFVLRRAPDADRPDHSYALFWTGADDGPEPVLAREVGRGDYGWALRTARTLSIPQASIEHVAERGGVDDGYEGWHLNAHVVVTRDSA